MEGTALGKGIIGIPKEDIRETYEFFEEFISCLENKEIQLSEIFKKLSERKRVSAEELEMDVRKNFAKTLREVNATIACFGIEDEERKWNTRTEGITQTARLSCTDVAIKEDR